MRVERVTLWLIELRLKAPFETSFGRETDRELIIVRLDAEGVTGWGEVSTMAQPLYNYETGETAWHVLERFLIPAVIGRDFADPRAFRSAYRPIRGHHMAKAGLENAFWDAYAKSRGMSLAAALGGKKERIPVGVSIGIQPSIPALLQAVENFAAQGYRRFKIKIKPGWDVEPIAAVRKRFGDALPVMADANSAYTLDQIDVLRRLDEFGLMMIEQPLGEDDIVDHARLQAQLETPVCLDESILTAEDARKAFDLGSCRIINAKVGRLGGLCEVQDLNALCLSRGAPLWCGGMLESGVGRAINIALTAMPGFTLPGDTSASDRYYHEDIVEPSARLSPDGTLDVPKGPGIGVEVVLARVERAAKRTREFRAGARA